MTKKVYFFIKGRLLFSVFAVLLLSSIYMLNMHRFKVEKNTCTDLEVGISLVLPHDWSCHSSEQDGFYIQPPWVETIPNTGPSPQFNVWFKKKPDYSSIKVDPRFCNINEYSAESTECPESVYYSHNGFEIKKLVSQKMPEYGISTSYVGIYKDYLRVQFSPSSSDFELSSGDKKNLDSIFDSIKKI